VIYKLINCSRLFLFFDPNGPICANQP